MPVKKEFPALLSAGMHDMSLPDLADLCVHPFKTARRHELFENLQVFTQQIQQLGAKGVLWIDGSFLTIKQEPDDVDIVVELDIATLQALDLATHHLISASITNAKHRYRCDAYATTNGGYHDKDRAYWRGLFGFFRDETTPKGIARITF